jgi:hypothetical protein
MAALAEQSRTIHGLQQVVGNLEAETRAGSPVHEQSVGAGGVGGSGSLKWNDFRRSLASKSSVAEVEELKGFVRGLESKLEGLLEQEQQFVSFDNLDSSHKYGFGRGDMSQDAGRRKRSVSMGFDLAGRDTPQRKPQDLKANRTVRSSSVPPVERGSGNAKSPVKKRRSGSRSGSRRPRKGKGRYDGGDGPLSPGDLDGFSSPALSSLSSDELRSSSKDNGDADNELENEIVGAGTGSKLNDTKKSKDGHQAFSEAVTQQIFLHSEEVHGKHARGRSKKDNGQLSIGKHTSTESRVEKDVLKKQVKDLLTPMMHGVRAEIQGDMRAVLDAMRYQALGGDSLESGVHSQSGKVPDNGEVDPHQSSPGNQTHYEADNHDLSTDREKLKHDIKTEVFNELRELGFTLPEGLVEKKSGKGLGAPKLSSPKSIKKAVGLQASVTTSTPPHSSKKLPFDSGRAPKSPHVAVSSKSTAAVPPPGAVHRTIDVEDIMIRLKHLETRCNTLETQLYTNRHNTEQVDLHEGTHPIQSEAFRDMQRRLDQLELLYKSMNSPVQSNTQHGLSQTSSINVEVLRQPGPFGITNSPSSRGRSKSLGRESVNAEQSPKIDDGTESKKEHVVSGSYEVQHLSKGMMTK